MRSPSIQSGEAYCDSIVESPSLRHSALTGYDHVPSGRTWRTPNGSVFAGEPPPIGVPAFCSPCAVNISPCESMARWRGQLHTEESEKIVLTVEVAGS